MKQNQASTNILFGEELLAEIRDAAESRGMALAALVRLFCERGLEMMPANPGFPYEPLQCEAERKAEREAECDGSRFRALWNEVRLQCDAEREAERDG